MLNGLFTTAFNRVTQVWFLCFWGVRCAADLLASVSHYQKAQTIEGNCENVWRGG
ncbi:hypothetical protein O5901_19110 [Proteus mirabilis]|nr:hypothetical protein [Proteus mirabilis]